MSQPEDTTSTTSPDDEFLEPAENPEPSAAQCRPKRPLWKRILIGLGITVVVLVFSAIMLYQFGSMWVPSAETKAAYQQLADAGQAPPVEQRFHIPIPGCVCHSSDPVLTMQHSTRRISQCMECHGN